MATKPNVLNACAQAVASAFTAAHDTAGLIDTMCASVQKLYKGADVPNEDADFIADEVSRMRNWTGNSARVRKAEVCAILSAYESLPGAMSKLRSTKANKKPVSFEAGLKLARLIKGTKTRAAMSVTSAVAAYIEGNTVTKPADRSLEDSLKSAKISVNSILAHKALPAKFRAALAGLCVEHNITI